MKNVCYDKVEQKSSCGESSCVLFTFWTFCVSGPLFEGLETTYDDHLRLVGKCIGDFLLLLISVELFSLVRTAEALRAIIGSKSAISL